MVFRHGARLAIRQHGHAEGDAHHEPLALRGDFHERPEWRSQKRHLLQCHARRHRGIVPDRFHAQQIGFHGRCRGLGIMIEPQRPLCFVPGPGEFAGEKLRILQPRLVRCLRRSDVGPVLLLFAPNLGLVLALGPDELRFQLALEAV